MLLLVLVGGGIFSLLRFRTEQKVPALFVDLPLALQPGKFPESGTAKRQRWVHLDPKGLERLREIGGEFRLNLFPDVEVTGVVGAHKTQSYDDQAVLGYIEENPWDSTLVLARNGKVMAGSVMLGDGRQMLISHVSDGAYVVLEVDPLKIGGCSTCDVELMQRKSNAQKPQSQLNDEKPQEKKSKKSAAAGDLGALTRRFAMARSNVPTAACGHAIVPRVAGTNPRLERYRPLLAALGAPRPVLAAGYSGGMHGTGEKATDLDTGPTTPGRVERRLSSRGATRQFVDIMFMITEPLIMQEGGYGPFGYWDTDWTTYTRIQAECTLMIDTLNQIFEDSMVPVEVRQAGFLEVPQHRAMTAMGDIWDPAAFELVASGYPADAPMWQQTKAPVRPDYSAKDANGLPNPKVWTTWWPIM